MAKVTLTRSPLSLSFELLALNLDAADEDLECLPMCHENTPVELFLSLSGTRGIVSFEIVGGYCYGVVLVQATWSSR